MKSISFENWEALKKFIERQKNFAEKFYNSPNSVKCYKIILEQMKILERINEREEIPEGAVYKRMWYNMKATVLDGRECMVKGKHIFNYMENQELIHIIKKKGEEEG